MFVLFPTGFGKSIIYEILPFLFDHKLRRVEFRVRSLVIIVSISYGRSSGLSSMQGSQSSYVGVQLRSRLGVGGTPTFT